MTDDGVVANETMVVEPCPEERSGEIDKLEGGGPDDPTDVVVKDVGPPDGGYGWVVVGYVSSMEMVVTLVRFAC